MCHGKIRSVFAVRFIVGLIIACALLWAPEVATAAELLLTADTEGHITPCQTCPTHAGQGGMARRATAIHQLRSDPAFADGALLDAGNALFGIDSIDSHGQIITAAYNALGYDAINVSYRDFRFGKDQTLSAVKQAKCPVLSANLLDASTNVPLFAPYCVLKRPGARWAVIGLTERPAAMDYLPHLKRQLAGVNIQPSMDALTQWLPKAKAESDQIILLYYGSSAGLNPIRQTFGGQLAAILVGGIRPDELPAGATPPLLASEEHGKSIGRLTLAGAAPAKADQVAVTPETAADPAVQKMLAEYTAQATPVAAPTVAPPPQPADQTASSGSAGQPQQSAQPQAQSGGRSPFSGLGGGLMGSAGGSSSPPPATTKEPPTTAAPTSTSPQVVPPPSQPPQSATTPPATAAPSPAPARPGVVAKRVPAHQNLTPKGIEGVGLTAEQVNAAIDRGASFLWNYIQVEDLQKHNHKFGDDREHILAALALVHCGVHRKSPEFDRDLRAYLTRVDPYVLGTYEDALLSMTIEAYADPGFFEKQRQTCRVLIEGQGGRGSWSYGISLGNFAREDSAHGPALRVIGGAGTSPGQSMDRMTEWTKGMDGDNSCSQFALLGLQAATHCGTAVAPVVWQKSLDAFRTRELPDGGWGYDPNATDSYGSMSCAGICSTMIDLFQLGQPHPEQNEAVERGIGWLDANFSVQVNPPHRSYLYYYLYSLERVGRILDTEFIGSHEWYPLGARFLIDNQKPDGSWLEPGETDPRLATSFALLFLTRATPKLALEIKHGGPGTLKADIESPPPSHLYIILDASGSMLDEMEGHRKFDVARDAVWGLITALPDTTQVALRVYGHRKQSIEKDSDLDTALELPMAPLDRAKFKAKLQSLRPRGKTPLALSLTQAMSDLGGVSPGSPATLVLLTDGGEDTFPRRDPVKVAAQVGAMAGLTFHIVGFDINQPEWGQELRAMAQASNGHFWPASKPDALPTQLRAAVFGRPDDFTILSSDGRALGRGQFGHAITLPEGKYQLKTAYGGAEATVEFAIATDATTAVLFDASRLPRGPTIAADSSQTSVPSSAAPASASPHRFCTHCGKPLPPGAKFCPSCGQKVE